MNKMGMIVTGAAGSLGKAICEKFVDTYFLILIDKNKPSFISELENQKKAVFFEIDIIDYYKIKQLREKIKNYNIRVMVLAAGIIEPRSFKESTLEEWERTISINLTSNYVLCKEFSEFLVNNCGGHIVFIGSVLSKVAGYDLISYSVSKAGLDHLSRNLALELMHDNIYVNCICPGFLDTQMLQKVKRNKDYNINWIYTLGGLKNYYVRVEDIVELICLLINQQSINGETIIVDNGYSLR